MAMPGAIRNIQELFYAINKIDIFLNKLDKKVSRSEVNKKFIMN